MWKRVSIRTYALIMCSVIGALSGYLVYSLFLEQTKRVQARNIDETVQLLQQNLRSFDIVALENISRVLYGADYVAALNVVTGSGFVVFDGRKHRGGVVERHAFAEPRDNGDVRRLGTVVIEVQHDPNALRNVLISCLTGALLAFLLARLIFSARNLKNELAVRKASEHALRAQETNLRILLNSLMEAVIATDSDGRITQMNHVAERLTGWRLADAEGRPVDQVLRIFDGKTRERKVGQFGQAVAPYFSILQRDDVVLVDRNGVEYAISQSVAPMIGNENHIPGVVIVFRDITAESQAQQRIREMEKMQAIGVLAGGIAHDFNNLLGIISASAEIIAIKEKGGLTSSSAKLLDTIVRTTRRGADLTSRLLAVGDKKNAEQSPFSLHASIKNVVTVLQRTIDKRFDIEIQLRADNDRIMGNATLIENALLNIGLNASQAMKDDKGTFRIVTENIDLRAGDDAVRMHRAPIGPCVRITLLDQGVGIPTENLSRIFEPFFTNRRGGGGFGLGLWAVYNTIRDHGGTIYVESQLGVETVFFIYLPISFARMTLSPPGRSNMPSYEKRILIVDDEEDIRLTLAAMLTSLGCHPCVAVGGDQAIQILLEEGDAIDVVMMDLNMPDRSGEDTITEILKINPAIPIIISSGYATSSKIASRQDAGRFLYLKKPYLLSDLAATLSELFADHAAKIAPVSGPSV